MIKENEKKEVIKDALNQLSPKQREVFTLYHYEGMGIKEIAEKFGIPEGTVKVHNHRAITKLREILGPLYA